jgi:hypothetical protein
MVANLLFKQLITDLKREQRKISNKIKILQRWTGEGNDKKRTLASTRAHSARMKAVWRAKRKLSAKKEK